MKLAFNYKKYLKGKLKASIPPSLIRFRLPRLMHDSILLTFDDGPSKETTPKVLELLDNYGAKAMFFVVGHRIEKCPEVLSLIAEKGHIICNHSFSHDGKLSYNPIAIFREIKRCQEVIKYCGVQDGSFFRPPNGRLSVPCFLVAKLMKMKIVFWSLEGQDWKCKTWEEAIEIGNAMAGKLSGGDIILLHDDNQNVLKILDIVLKESAAQKLNLRPVFDKLL